MARVFPSDPVSTALGTEVRAEMFASDISVTDLATRISVDRGTLSDWLAAKRPMPVPAMVSIARELRMPPHELFKRAEDRARRDDVRA